MAPQCSSVVAAAICLALHAPRALGSAEDECGGPGELRYDWGDNYTLYSGIHAGVQPLCPPYIATTASVAQLLTPPELPWKLTRVCFALHLLPDSHKALPRRATVSGTVSLYPFDLMPVYGPGHRLSYATFSRELSYDPNASSTAGVAPTWVSVDVSGLDSPMVFVGVSYWSCGNVQMVGVNMASQGRLAFTYRQSSSRWYRYKGADAFAIRTTGTKHAAGVPPTWVCDRSKYGDGNCDCYCGAGDVDCTTNFTSDCGPGHVCDQTGRCAEVDWGVRGVCNVSNYWQYDGCQCECGEAADPDCLDTHQPVRVCPPSTSHRQQVCDLRQTGPVCTEWRCDLAAYDDGRVCDCECGLADPDCDGFLLNSTCPDNWLCVNGKCAAPRKWSCPSAGYNDGKQCQCRCGVYDPDCDNASLYVFHCGIGKVCNYQSECVDPDLTEDCDGGVGCHNCLCTAGYYPKTPLREDCETRCGNGVLEAELNESCDGGDGCSGECQCRDGWAAVGARDCESLAQADGQFSRRKVIISSTVGSVCGLVLLVGIVASLFYVLKVKNGPRKLNVPVEIDGNPHSGFSSVLSGAGYSVDAVSASDALGPPGVVPVVAPDCSLFLGSSALVAGSSGSSSTSSQLPPGAQAQLAAALGPECDTAPLAAAGPLGPLTCNWSCASGDDRDSVDLTQVVRVDQRMPK
eukprot:m51a1_g7247 putative protein kinase domain containing protein (686) ;mRNA; f:127105-130004